MEDLPGTYVLVLQMVRDTDLRVGRLGVVAFPRGYYCYVGSAMGPGGRRARLARHLRQQKKPHWHIDYLLRQALVVETWSAPSAARLECTWVRALLQLPGATLPVRGFGSSDCDCPAHLVRFVSAPSLMAFARQLQPLGLEVLPHKVTPQQIPPR
ncbi:MAG TPA: GIY-YIG nuclease family protein [Anaerolineae bacterium]|nr:GIY-YIG nuclease family protein [Anaerolineae bacterium]